MLPSPEHIGRAIGTVAWLLHITTATVGTQIPAAGAESLAPRGLWVWDTDPLLTSSDDRATFFDFCTRHHITVAGMYVRTEETSQGRRLRNAAGWTAVLGQAGRLGMRLHALDGDPDYARRAHHREVLAMIDAVIAYNRSAPPAARFHGVHLDVEPYLLPEWKQPQSREQLLAEYLEMNRLAAARARAAALVYGVDIPFWWLVTDPSTGEAISITTFNGRRATATEHLLTMVDNIGVMAYRNVVTGANGVISIALDTLDKADAINQAEVFIGLETEKITDGVPAQVTFAAKSAADLKKAVSLVEQLFVGRPAFAGVAVHRYVTFRELENLLRSPK